MRSFAFTVFAILAGCADQQDRSSSQPEPEQATAAAALTSTPSETERDRREKRRPRSILLAEAREVVSWRVADGFLQRHEIIEAGMEAADERETLRPEVERVVDEELETHRQRELTWKYATDVDRLIRSFQALERKGIIARERFSDCRKCGVAEMKTAREDLLDRGQRAEGYVFYTDQDADGVSHTGELVLEYGSFREDEAATARIGATVKVTLAAAQLEAIDETDDESSYLVLSGLEWRRRRFTRAPR